MSTVLYYRVGKPAREHRRDAWTLVATLTETDTGTNLLFGSTVLKNHVYLSRRALDRAIRKMIADHPEATVEPNDLWSKDREVLDAGERVRAQEFRENWDNRLLANAARDAGWVIVNGMVKKDRHG